MFNNVKYPLPSFPKKGLRHAYILTRRFSIGCALEMIYTLTICSITFVVSAIPAFVGFFLHFDKMMKIILSLNMRCVELDLKLPIFSTANTDKQ